MKKRLLFFFMAIASCVVLNAQDENFNQKNSFGAKLRESNFHLGVDLQTKYIWRGMEMIVKDAAPVVFPQVNYQFKGICLYVMGGTALNGKYAEVDLGANYNWKWLTVALNNYYYPSIDNPKDHYFECGGRNTGHWWEGVITIAPECVPVYLSVSNFFAGADKNFVGRQAYSTYAEVGAHYDFLKHHDLSLSVGTALNESCYNAYEHGFGVCNIEMKYTYYAVFKSGWNLPLSCSYILNPVNEKSFVNLTTSISL